MCTLMLAVTFGVAFSVAVASPVQCKSGDRSNCILESGARFGGAMIQRPTDKDGGVTVKLALVQTPLKSRLENLQAEVQSMTDRVAALSGQVGLAAPAAAALQAIKIRVSHRGTADSNTAPKAPAPRKISELSSQVKIGAPSREASEVSGFVPLQLPGHARKASEVEKFENIDKHVERSEFPMLVEVGNDEDGTLKTIIEDLEVKCEDLKSKVLDLENMVLGTNALEPVATKPSGNETSSSLASRATIIELEVASLRTRLSSLEQAVTGTQTAHAGAAAAA